MPISAERAVGAGAELHARAEATARRVLEERRLGRATPLMPIPRSAYSTLIESDYARRLIEVVSQAREAAAHLVSQVPELAGAAARGHARVDSGGSRLAHELVQRARERVAWLTRREATARMVEQIGRREIVHQHGQFAAQVRAALGIELWTPSQPRSPAIARLDDPSARADSVGSRLDHFVTWNASLIRSLGDQPLAEIERLLLRELAAGAHADDITAGIMRRFDVAESAARLIARDQLGKLHAYVAAERQREIGVTRWRWRSFGDELVRRGHKPLEDNEYDHADDGERPPFMPGQHNNCRCLPEPIFAHILNRVAQLQAEL
jgi:SPP1 gp7 family putative phage head morphogenesis protein